MSDAPEVQKELTALVNRLSLENASDTPDFIIASFLHEVLGAWSTAVQQREQWYGRRKMEADAPAEDEAPRQPDGAELIEAERRRQVTEEGWTPEHDDRHAHCELARAAAVYVLDHATDDSYWPEQLWPWEMSWYRHDADPIRNLVKAGALIAAEIDRLRRSTPQGEEGGDG